MVKMPSDAEMLAMASCFDIIPYNPHTKNRFQELKVERRRTDPEAWAIVNRRAVLSLDGEWEYEPMPSSRDDEFFKRCRWPSAGEAIRFVLEYLEANPSGSKT